jgi:transposase
MFDPTRLVFIDETAVSTNLVRLKGRGPRGERVIGSVPLGSWQTITFVAALRHNKMTAPLVVEGAMSGEMFLAYVEQCLIPTLKRNDIVVMDNCRVHLGPGIRQAIEKARATLRYLPKYSPDLNPIELPYSKFKTFLRKVAARTVPRLNRAIRAFIPQLGPQECLPPINFFLDLGNPRVIQRIRLFSGGDSRHGGWHRGDCGNDWRRLAAAAAGSEQETA